jgi:hypothetical protein
MSEIRLIDDQTRTGAAGRINLNQNGMIIDDFAVESLLLQLTYNGDNAQGTAQPLYADDGSWAYNQRVTVELSDGSRVVDNVPVGLVDVAESYNFQTDTPTPSLDTAPQFTASASGENQSVFLRIPVKWNLASRGRDFWRSLSTVGAVYYDYSNTGVDADITVNSVRAQLYAVGQSVNSILVPPPLRTQYFTPTSDLVDRLNIGGDRLIMLAAVTTDASGNPITGITQPQVSIDGRLVTDGRQLIESSDLQAIAGEARYAASNRPPFGVSGAGGARTRFQVLYAASNDFKLSEIKPCKAVQLTYSAQPIAGNTLYYVAVTVGALPPGRAAAQVPSLRGMSATQIQSLAGRKVAGPGVAGASLQACLPVTFQLPGK